MPAPIRYAAAVTATASILTITGPALADDAPWDVTHPTQAPTAAPGPGNPQASPDWWTVTRLTVPATRTPTPVHAPATTVPAHAVVRRQMVRRVAQHARRTHARPARVAHGHAETASTWYVGPGDNLSLIAQATRTRWPAIAAANARRHPSIARFPHVIHLGWTLRIPAVR